MSNQATEQPLAASRGFRVGDFLAAASVKLPQRFHWCLMGFQKRPRNEEHSCSGVAGGAPCLRRF